MTTRDRWTIYPLLFLAIGLALNACIQSQADHSAFEGKLVRAARLEGDLVRGEKIEGDVVICKELVVINESGKPVVQVTTNKAGAGVLQTANGNGAFQVVLTADSAGGVLRTLDVNGRYFQFPPAERRPLVAQPNEESESKDEQPAAKDGKAEK
jgi:hypothetical protein